MSEDKQVKSPKILVDVVGKEGIEDFFHKIEQTKNKKFEEYLIAYIDFLGIKEKMIKNGAKAALMSGSGTTVFGIFDSEAMAKKSAASFYKQYKEVFLCKTN